MKISYIYTMTWSFSLFKFTQDSTVDLWLVGCT